MSTQEPEDRPSRSGQFAQSERQADNMQTLLGYSLETYQQERALLNKAQAYWDSVQKHNSITAAQAKHPDYTAVDNDMKSRVETWEFQHELPDKYFAYCDVQSTRILITTWMGQILADGYRTGEYRSNFGDRRITFRVRVTGSNVWYTGTAYVDAGGYVRMRRAK